MLANQNRQAVRKKICGRCKYQRRKWFFFGAKQCEKCKCFIDLKVKFQNQKCHIELW